jgi:hypothetical protein
VVQPGDHRPVSAGDIYAERTVVPPLGDVPKPGQALRSSDDGVIVLVLQPPSDEQALPSGQPPDELNVNASGAQHE